MAAPKEVSSGNVKSLRLGYDPDPVLVVNLNMRGVELDSVRAVALRRRLLESAQGLPGVTHASLNTSIPFWSTWSIDFSVPGLDSVSRCEASRERREGRERIFELRPQRLAAAHKYLDKIGRQWDAALGRLQTHLAKENERGR